MLNYQAITVKCVEWFNALANYDLEKIEEIVRRLPVIPISEIGHPHTPTALCHISEKISISQNLFIPFTSIQTQFPSNIQLTPEFKQKIIERLGENCLESVNGLQLILLAIHANDQTVNNSSENVKEILKFIIQVSFSLIFDLI